MYSVAAPTLTCVVLFFSPTKKHGHSSDPIGFPARDSPVPLTVAGDSLERDSPVVNLSKSYFMQFTSLWCSECDAAYLWDSAIWPESFWIFFEENVSRADLTQKPFEFYWGKCIMECIMGHFDLKAFGIFLGKMCHGPLVIYSVFFTVFHMHCAWIKSLSHALSSNEIKWNKTKQIHQSCWTRKALCFHH